MPERCAGAIRPWIRGLPRGSLASSHRREDPMMSMNFDYGSCVRASEKVSWKLDDVFPPDLKLDFGKRFLPDAIASADELAFLSPAEKLKLNQITGNSYLYLFYFVEEYIIA